MKIYTKKKALFSPNRIKMFNSGNFEISINIILMYSYNFCMIKVTFSNRIIIMNHDPFDSHGKCIV